MASAGLVMVLSGCGSASEAGDVTATEAVSRARTERAEDGSPQSVRYVRASSGVRIGYGPGPSGDLLWRQIVIERDKVKSARASRIHVFLMDRAGDDLYHELAQRGGEDSFMAFLGHVREQGRYAVWVKPMVGRRALANGAVRAGEEWLRPGAFAFTSAQAQDVSVDTLEADYMSDTRELLLRFQVRWHEQTVRRYDQYGAAPAHIWLAPRDTSWVRHTYGSIREQGVVEARYAGVLPDQYRLFVQPIIAGLPDQPPVVSLALRVK